MSAHEIREQPLVFVLEQHAGFLRARDGAGPPSKRPLISKQRATNHPGVMKDEAPLTEVEGDAAERQRVGWLTKLIGIELIE